MDSEVVQVEEDHMNTILLLTQQLKTSEDNVELAAKYGKQLLEGKFKLSERVEELSLKNEELEQEKHSLQINLQAQIEALKNQGNELDFHIEKAESFTRKYETFKSENDVLMMKLKNLTKENEYLRNMQENLQLENNSYKKKNEVLENQIKEFQNQAELTLCEVNDEDIIKLQNDLNSYMNKNKCLQDDLSAAQYTLEQAKLKEERLLHTMKALEEEILEKDHEIAVYFTEIEKAKEENAELQAEIEARQFANIDVNRKGNSVFAELDDRRLRVEAEYIKLKDRYLASVSLCEEYKKDLSRAKGHIQLLMTMASRKCDVEYIEELEKLLSTARNDVQLLTNSLNKEIKKQELLLQQNECEQLAQKGDTYDYLQAMLKKSREQVNSVNSELMALRSRNLVDNSRVIETERRLHQVEKRLCNVQDENAKLLLRINESTPIETDIEDMKKNQPVQKADETKKLTSTPKSIKTDEENDHDYIIPGILDMCGGDEGFRQIRSPRKSNRWKIQQFSKAIQNGEVIISNKENTQETVRKDETPKEIKRNEKPRTEKVINHLRIKDSNCAQQ